MQPTIWIFAVLPKTNHPTLMVTLNIVLLKYSDLCHLSLQVKFVLLHNMILTFTFLSDSKWLGLSYLFLSIYFFVDFKRNLIFKL